MSCVNQDHLNDLFLYSFSVTFKTLRKEMHITWSKHPFIAFSLTIVYVCLHVCSVKKRVFCYIFSFYTILRENKLTRCIFDHCKLQRCTETQTQIHDMSSLVFFIYANSFLFIKYMTFELFISVSLIQNILLGRYNFVNVAHS